jgi:hypothetical protein
VIGELVGQAARVGIEAVEQDTDELGVEDYLVSLDQHRGSGCYSHVTFALLGLALGELRVHRATTGLGRNHGIHQADAAADRLRARYRALAPAQGTL